MSNSKPRELIYHKCKAKDCKRKIEEPYLFCSIECACYSGCYSLRTGDPKFNKDGWNLDELKKYLRGK